MDTLVPPFVNLYRVPYNSTECYEEIMPPSNDSVLFYDQRYYYFPFGGGSTDLDSLDSYAYYPFERFPYVGDFFDLIRDHYLSLGSVLGNGANAECDETYLLPSGLTFRDATMYKYEAVYWDDYHDEDVTYCDAVPSSPSAYDVQEVINGFEEVFETLVDLDVETECYDAICNRLKTNQSYVSK